MMAAPTNIRVLLVDDELTFAYMMRDELTGEGFDVSAYTRLGAAVHALSRDPYDVVVTDLILSERDGASGLDLIERVRRDYPTLAVVVLAGEPSLSERQLLKANVPVVSKGPTSFDVLPGVIVDAVRTAREAKHNRAGGEIQGSGGASGSLDHARHVYSKEAERLQQRKESTVILPDGHFDLPKAIQGYKEDIERRLIRCPYQKNVFLMMKFRDSNRSVSDFICDTLHGRGFLGIRADAKEWNITNNVYNPIAVLHCCKYGIALFDKAESRQVFSPNVAYELGVLHQQNKNCLVLKHSSLPTVPFDLIKDLCREYNSELRMRDIIVDWIEQISFDEASQATARSKSSPDYA